MRTMKSTMKQVSKMGKAVAKACTPDEPEPVTETKTEKAMYKARAVLEKAEIAWHDNPTRANERAMIKAQANSSAAWLANDRASRTCR